MTRDVLDLGSSLGFLDEIYEAYLASPDTVDPSWAEVFGDAPRATTNGQTNGHAAASSNGTSNGASGSNGQPTGASGSNGHSNGNGQAAATLRSTTRTTRPMPTFARPSSVTMSPIVAQQAPSVWPLVNAYRSVGHFAAKLDPLGLLETARVVELEPATWGFSSRDLDQVIEPTGVHGLPNATLGELLERLETVYAGSVGLEFMHISSAAKRSWLAERMETRLIKAPPVDTRMRMLQLLINSEQFERFCHTKYPGTKRFSLEGSESVIPMVDRVLTTTARLGAIEAVIGMAHRGRLTAIDQIMKRPARELFGQFEDIEPEKAMGGGDVKYHLGFSSDRVDPDGRTMHLSLAFNPSHLEAVDPVVAGRVRAKQNRHHDPERMRVVGVMIHGDAAFAGQGLVPETLQLSGLAGYRTGGTVHVVINNQVGFTASPAEQRSTPYCTDIAKMLECPIWHVNGEDLDALAHVVDIACEYRTQFGADVVIDLYCFRKYGHNENDEPSFTQPIMYDRIKQKASPVEVYTKRLIDDGTTTPEAVQKMTSDRVHELDGELEAAKAAKLRPESLSMTAMWRGYRGGIAEAPDDIDTRLPMERLNQLAVAVTSVPEGFTPHPKIVRLLEQRAEMGRGERKLDWGMAEIMAYASLLREGTDVRLSGQDCARGTFSHRHAIITDITNGREHLVLGGIDINQGQCRIYDSPLSEAGVLGFEFGYSLDYPDALVLWEAQFGDFANGAQVIIDQFITSSEDKWRRLSGLVMLLPHGYEGQGPEHSSARLERYLQSCAEHNVQVAQPTTPAQMYHLLRRQVLRPTRKPLIVMTPKSLLRLPAAASPVEDLATGTFQRVIPDTTADPDKVTRALFCSGKIYYEIIDDREKRKVDDVAIIRIEMLYPWWPDVVADAIARYKNLKDVMWVQDEPSNMGAATFVTPRLEPIARARNCTYDMISRSESASPATGSHKAHVIETQQILAAAFKR